MKSKKSNSRSVNGSVSDRILRDIEHHILSGLWAPGHKIPFEHQLMQEYGCSRMTVSKVISALSSRGLVFRRRRAGTFVATPEIEQSLLEIRDFEQQAQLAGFSYTYQLLECRVGPVDKTEAGRLDLPAGYKVVRLLALHRINDLPVALERRVINSKAVPGVLDESFRDIAPGAWLLKTVPWTEAEHLIRAVPADKKTAGLLEIREGSACLLLDRRTWRTGMPVTEVILIHPGERYHFAGRFQPMSTGSSQKKRVNQTSQISAPQPGRK